MSGNRPARADAGQVQGEAGEAEQEQAQRREDGGGGGGCRVKDERDDEEGGGDVTEHVCPSLESRASRRLPGSGTTVGSLVALVLSGKVPGRAVTSMGCPVFIGEKSNV